MRAGPNALCVMVAFNSSQCQDTYKQLYYIKQYSRPVVIHRYLHSYFRTFKNSNKRLTPEKGTDTIPIDICSCESTCTMTYKIQVGLIVGLSTHISS